MTQKTQNAPTLPAGIWKLETKGTTTTVTVKKLGLITVVADLALVEGSISIDASGAVTAIDVAVDAASYDSGNNKRDEHVRGTDFLDTAAHPQLTFTAADVVSTATGYLASGTVTVKGKTAPLSFDIAAVTFDDASGTFTANASIDRNAIGVDKMPSFVIARELKLAVSARAVLADG